MSRCENRKISSYQALQRDESCWTCLSTEAADLNQAGASTISLDVATGHLTEGSVRVTLVQRSSWCKVWVSQGVAPFDVSSLTVRRKEFLTSSGQNNGRAPLATAYFFGEFSCFPWPRQNSVFSFNRSAQTITIVVFWPLLIFWSIFRNCHFISPAQQQGEWAHSISLGKQGSWSLFFKWTHWWSLSNHTVENKPQPTHDITQIQ